MLSTISLESSVRRILVEKRQGFDLEAKALKKDLIESLHIDTIENVRILNRYDIEGIYGEVYENAAKTTQMTEDDIEKLLSGIWNGTKNLVTRSKFGQTPRLLLQIEYSEDNFFIGDLNNKISLKHTIEDKKIRNINEVKLGYDKLKENLSKNKDKISKIRYKIDNNLDTTDESKNLIEVIKSLDIQTEEIIL